MVKGVRAVLLSAVLGACCIPLHARAQLGSLVVTMTAPGSGSTVSGTTTVSASVSIIGLLTVQSVQFQLDGNNLGGADSSSPYSISWNTTGASNGSHTLSAVATATLGLQFSANPITVTVNNGPPPDTTPPSVNLTAPANGATVSGTVSVSASASDNVGVAGVQFLLDGAGLGAEDTSAPYSVSWNTTGAANGAHTLTAVARDAAGNQSSSAVTVTVNNGPPPDTTPPAVNLTAPSNGTTVSGTVTVSASASDNVGVAGVQFTLDGANLGAEDTASPYSVSWNTTGVANGSHTLTATARDAAGNRSSSAVTVTVNNGPPPDTMPPSVTITAPANGATVSGTVTVSANASDNVGVVGVQFQLDGVNGGAEDTAAPYAISWNTTGAANGTHTVTAIARDAAGNRTTSAAVTVTVSNGPPPDTTPPSVNITAPANGATVSGTVTVSANASDNVGVVGVQFFGDGMALGAEDTSSPFSIAVDTTASSNGAHTLTAVARDAAGNRTTSAPVTVTVNNTPPDTTPPTASLTAPANGATVSGTVTVSANASDNVGVVGVTFFGDGMALGAEDTSAPFSIPVDTTASSNGPHTLTAVARDAAGNQTTSTAVTVTVSNGPPPDTTPPTASLTAPANGATVSGTVAVSASASDNVGVAGVQFTLDGASLGSEDAASPYSISWNTSGVANGTHTLAAVARDAAGNRTTSASVTVTVANNAQPTKRFEDTDPSVAYTSGWMPDPYAALSGGGATVSNAAGAQATFTFTGTSVSWIGGRSVETGIAQVFLDGNLVAQVDTYSKTKEVQVPMFTAVGLANTSHALMIQVTGQKNAAATLAYIIVDAFDVPAATISRLQETDPAVVFAGTGWIQGDTSNDWSGGTTAGSLTAGDTATFTFNGTGVRWLGETGPQNGGIANVTLDGTFATQVDTYAPGDNTVEVELFKATGLADGSHTLTIEVTGQKDPAAVTAAVTVDAFDVITSGTRREETDPAVSYSAGWSPGNIDHPYSEGTAAVSTAAGAQATFTFSGTSVSWLGFRGPQMGIASVILDGTIVASSLDTYVAKDAPQEVVFTLSGLAPGNHTLTVQATGSKNPASTGTAIVVDAFDVSP